MRAQKKAPPNLRPERKQAPPSRSAAGPTDPRVEALIAALESGTDDDRDEAIEAAANLPEPVKRACAERLQALFETSPVAPGLIEARRRWILSALAAVDRSDFAVRLLTEAAGSDSDEWTRYWCLAHLWAIDRDVAKTASRRRRSDDSFLVRVLAHAILSADDAAARRKLARALFSPANVEVFGILRALQVVPDFESIRDALSLLRAAPHPDIAYEIVLLLAIWRRDLPALLSTAEIGAADFIGYVIAAAAIARRVRLRQFAELLRGLDAETVRTALANAATSSSDLNTRTAAEKLLALLGVSMRTAVPLPAGALRLRFAYLAALDQPGRYTMLDEMTVAALREAAVAVARSAQSPMTPEQLVATLEGRWSHAHPNPLWTAWMSRVHAAKLTQE